MMNTIDPSFYLKNQTTDRTPSTELGKDEFIKILMTQLQNQDPLNPMEDRDFIAQMATFSSLEQMMNMSKSIDTLVQSQLMSPVIQYSHMIGKTVSYQDYDEETGKKGDLITAKVISVSQSEGWAILELDNGEKIYADSILEIKDASTETDEPEEDDAPSQKE